MDTFKIEEKDGSTTEYVVDAATGAVHQLYPERFVYDENYCATYDTPHYKLKSQALSRVRLAVIESAWAKHFQDEPIKSLLDCGYGNGDFLRYVEVTKTIDKLYGYDISGVPIPRGVTKAEWLPTIGYDVSVMTLWDCLEHFPDISFLDDIKANMIVISLPWCPFNLTDKTFNRMQAETTFRLWHHRKPNEHLHHFDRQALSATMKQYGWNMLFSTSVEDMIRYRGTDRNILTAAFVR